MHRRRLLQLLIILMVAGIILSTIFAGCRRKSPYESVNSYNSRINRPFPPGPSKITTLKVILQGPFVLIVRGDDKNRITAYVPYDQGKMHQFYYPDSSTPQKGASYSFVLSEEGLEISHRPHIDRGFDDFNVGLTNWKPNPKDYYVALDLPAPDVVSYIPPPEGVLFEPASPGSPPRFGRIPNNHVLEYRVQNASKITLNSPELGELHPTPCRDQRTRYGGGQQEGRGESNHEHPNMDRELDSCSQSVSYFLGVGLPNGWDVGPNSVYLKDHAIQFFNDKLLPSMFGAHVPQGLKLLRVEVDPSQGLQYTESPLTPAVLRYPLLPKPRIIEVGIGSRAGSNCLLSATAHTPGLDDK
jgi:hypothetical protein